MGWGSMKSARSIIAFGLAALLASAGLGSPPSAGLTFTALPLDRDDPGHVRVGSLRYLAGWQIQGRQPTFGGYSSLAVQGNRFLALNDAGEYLQFRMAKPGKADAVVFGVLPDYPGRKNTKGDRDSESMAIGPDGDIWVGFEQYQAIFRFGAGFRGVKARAFPAAMKDWPKNEGAEAMARLTDGRFVVLSEYALQPDDSTAALLFASDPTDPAAEPIRFGYVAPDGYRATDAAQLPDGRIAVLNRHFALADGMWMALTIIDPKDIRPGVALTGQLIAEIRPPLTIDNMEGLSVTQERGRTILWTISDDNQNGIQRTLLMKFELEK